MIVEVIRMVGGSWAVLVNGYQSGCKPGATFDRSGAGDDEFATREEARHMANQIKARKIK